MPLLRVISAIAADGSIPLLTMIPYLSASIRSKSPLPQPMDRTAAPQLKTPDNQRITRFKVGQNDPP